VIDWTDEADNVPRLLIGVKVRSPFLFDPHVAVLRADSHVFAAVNSMSVLQYRDDKAEADRAAVPRGIAVAPSRAAARRVIHGIATDL